MTRRTVPPGLALEFPLATWRYAEARGAGDLCNAYNQARAAIRPRDPRTITRARDAKAALIAAMPADDASRSSLADGTLPPLPSGLSEIHVSEAAPGRSLAAERITAPLRLVSPPRAAGRVNFDELAARRALYPRRTVDSQVTTPGWGA